MGKRKEPKPKLFGPDTFGWGGGLLREGAGGQKVRYVPPNPREPKLLAGYPRILLGYPRCARKSLRKKSLCSNFGPEANIHVFLTLKTHAPQIWGVTIHPPNLGSESSKIACFTVFFEGHSINLGGEIFTPQIWGAWVFRVTVSSKPCLEALPPQHSPDTINWILFRCSLRGQAVSGDTPLPYSQDTICWTLFRYTWKM